MIRNPVTVFIPLIDSTFVDSYDVQVYTGHLAEADVLHVGRMLTDGTGNRPRYARATLRGYYGHWTITYCIDNIPPRRTDNGFTYEGMQGYSKLRYIVRHRLTTVFEYPVMEYLDKYRTKLTELEKELGIVSCTYTTGIPLLQPEYVRALQKAGLAFYSMNFGNTDESKNVLALANREIDVSDFEKYCALYHLIRALETGHEDHHKMRLIRDYETLIASGVS